jgi:hypothetical protein
VILKLSVDEFFLKPFPSQRWRQKISFIDLFLPTPRYPAIRDSESQGSGPPFDC